MICFILQVPPKKRECTLSLAPTQSRSISFLLQGVATPCHKPKKQNNRILITHQMTRNHQMSLSRLARAYGNFVAMQRLTKFGCAMQIFNL